MYKLYLLDVETHKKFYKEFMSLFFLEQFKKKLKYSKKLIILGEIRGV